MSNRLHAIVAVFAAFAFLAFSMGDMARACAHAQDGQAGHMVGHAGMGHVPAHPCATKQAEPRLCDCSHAPELTASLARAQEPDPKIVLAEAVSDRFLASESLAAMAHPVIWSAGHEPVPRTTPLWLATARLRL